MTQFFIVAMQGALASSLGATLDVLHFAERCGAQPRSIGWQVLSEQVQTPLSGGLSIACMPLGEAELAKEAVLIVPGLGLDCVGLDEGADIQSRYDEERLFKRLNMPDAQVCMRLLQRHHQRGGRIAASCSGVLLLAMAGLLDGRRATTHWRLGQFVRKQFPLVQVDENRMLIDDGDILTAGAALAQIDLMLYLLQAAVGDEVVQRVMQYLLVDSRTTQARYRVWEHLYAEEDDMARRFDALIDASLPDVPTIADAAHQLGLTARTLSRRIAAITGAAPLQMVNTVRMRNAQRLLAQGDLSIEEVARKVGYANATALRKLTMKMAQLPPAVLRHAVDTHDHQQ